MHCSHKVYNVVADNLLKTLKPYLLKEDRDDNYGKTAQIYFHKVMEDYVRQKYLYQFPFAVFAGTVGAQDEYK